MVTIDDPGVGLRLAAAIAGLQPHDAVTGCFSAEFRIVFADAVAALKLGSFRLRPYSLRRGGATHHLRANNDLQLTLFRGRWSSLRVGKVYLTDGLAAWTELQLPPQTRTLLERYTTAV